METTKTIFSTVKSRVLKCNSCDKKIERKEACYTINVIKGTGEDNESGFIKTSTFCEKCYVTR